MAQNGEYLALVTAALVLTVVLVVSFMCIQLYRLRKPGPAPPASAPGPWSAGGRLEPFLGAFGYAPACGAAAVAGWGPGALRGCVGETSGAMPAIEVDGVWAGGFCPGALGVPP
jgi:hypothetical protein